MERPMVGAIRPYPQNYVNSIDTGRAGRWKYSPSFIAPSLHAETWIPLTGRRTQDYRRAEEEAQIQHQGRVTVWHHVHDYQRGGCTMQLVNWRNHSATVPHAGGCKQYSEAHQGQPYQATPMSPEDLQKLEDSLTVPAPMQHSAKALADFSLSTGKRLPSTLQQLLRGDRAISKKGLMTLATEHDLVLDALLPLTDSPDRANITDVMASMQSRGLTLGYSPLGIDPYGNDVCLDDYGKIYVSDHETGMYEAAGLDIVAILD